MWASRGQVLVSAGVLSARAGKGVERRRENPHTGAGSRDA